MVELLLPEFDAEMASTRTDFITGGNRSSVAAPKVKAQPARSILLFVTRQDDEPLDDLGIIEGELERKDLQRQSRLARGLQTRVLVGGF